MTLDSVFDDAHKRSYPKGQILLYQGEKTQDIFLIKKGYVKVYDVTAQGTEKLLMILGPEDLFPLIWTFRGVSSLNYFYETMSDAELCVVPRDKLITGIKDSHKLTVHLLEYFVDRTKELMTRIECIESAGSKQKVAQVLIYLATALGREVAKQGFKVSLPITHQSIADMAGIARETASIQLKELEDEKIFSSKKDILLIHIDRLNDFLGEE